MLFDDSQNGLPLLQGEPVDWPIRRTLPPASFKLHQSARLLGLKELSLAPLRIALPLQAQLAQRSFVGQGLGTACLYPLALRFGVLLLQFRQVTLCAYPMAAQTRRPLYHSRYPFLGAGKRRCTCKTLKRVENRN